MQPRPQHKDALVLVRLMLEEKCRNVLALCLLGQQDVDTADADQISACDLSVRQTWDAFEQQHERKCVWDARLPVGRTRRATAPASQHTDFFLSVAPEFSSLCAPAN